MAKSQFNDLCLAEMIPTMGGKVLDLPPQYITAALAARRALAERTKRYRRAQKGAKARHEDRAQRFKPGMGTRMRLARKES